MAFPDSAISFAALSNGATIQATDVGDVRTEVQSIEDGYLNATGRLNSSNSTLANLSVTGGSTFAGLITFSVPTVRVRHDADQAVANTAWTGLNWNSEAYDSTAMHSTATNSSRLTFAGSTGVYHVGASVEWNAASTAGVRMMRLVLNDSTAVIAAGMIGESFPGGVGHPQAVSGDWRVTSTADYATVQMWQNSGSTGSISSGAGGHPVAFFAHKVSA